MRLCRTPWASVRTSMFFTLWIIATLCLAVAAAGLTDPAPSQAPLNPAFTAYLHPQSLAAVQDYTSSGYTLGLIPSPVDLSHLAAGRGLQAATVSSYPASYDLRTQGKLTPIRDQGQCGSCWAFATYGSLESSLMPGESANFSENSLKNLHGYDVSCCDGGNSYMSAAYLARWAGPVLETSDPYNASTCTSPAGLSAAKHVQEILFLPDRTGPLDNDAIKEAVMQYGAVYTSYYHSDSYYQSTYYAYYFNGSATSNHAVCIVGWDDNFNANRFLTSPPGNGAFIIRNSWGTWWGQSGYFYMSYYDSNVGKDNTVFKSVEPATNYDHNYQYDPLGWVSNMGVGGTTGWFANVFTATASENVAAVSFYTSALNSTYELRVYIDPTGGPLKASGPSTTQTGSFADAGYHTVVLNSSVPVTSGHKFSAVVKLTTPGYNYPIPIESAVGGWTSTATASAGQSYYSSSGTSWSDLTGYISTGNVCLKAFTKAGASVPPITIGQVKSTAAGSTVALSHATISAAFTDFFYVEAPSRSCGIRVDKTAHGLTAGMAADVTGTVARNSDGELTIQATSAVQNGTGTVKPFSIPNRAVGGSTCGGQPGIPGSCGLNNIGLLVTVWGKFVKTSATTFTVDDGSKRPLKCLVPSGVSLDQTWLFVCVTGISSCETIGTDTHSLLRAESSSDITPLVWSSFGSISGTISQAAIRSVNQTVESAHPYKNSYIHTWSILGSGSTLRMRVHFTEIELETASDYLRVQNAAGTTVQTYNFGTATFDIWSNWVDGNAVKLNLTTDSSVTRYGFKMDKYEAQLPSTAPLAGVTITVTPGPKTAITGTDGTYTVSGLAAGVFTVTPSFTGATFMPTSASVTLTAGQNQTGIDFTEN